jgi:hypothetical protein
MGTNAGGEERPNGSVYRNNERAILQVGNGGEVAVERGSGADDNRGNTRKQVSERRSISFRSDGWQICERIEQVFAGESLPRLLVGARATHDLFPNVGTSLRRNFCVFGRQSSAVAARISQASA